MIEHDCCTGNQDCANKEYHTKLRMDDVQERSKRVLEMLSSKPMNYNEIVEQSGINSRYVARYLEYLVASKKVERVPQISNGARGRPKVLYSIPSNTNQPQPQPTAKKETEHAPIHTPQKHLPSTVAVEVEFSKLKSACRYEKGGNCKQKRDKCSISKCPLVLHTRLARKKN